MKRFTLQGFRIFFSSQSLDFDSSRESDFKLDFSKNGLTERGFSNQSRGRGIGSLILMLVLFSLFSNVSWAQQADLRLLTDAYTPGKCPANDIQVVGATFATSDPCSTCTWSISICQQT